ncbi:MAG TPA: reverse transcriptase domain-containing protein [Solirubrobacterales bacterium]|nr:reverse transcriptase domain-containing protein [Solirubrobacterales bacterium]
MTASRSQPSKPAASRRFSSSFGTHWSPARTRPLRCRRQAIPKDNGQKVRILSIPAIRDRVVQGALKGLLEPIFEAAFQPGSFGYRPKKAAHHAGDRVAEAIVQGKTRVVDLDRRSYVDSVRHDVLLAKVARRVNDADGLALRTQMLKASGKAGGPQGGVISPVLSNLYLTEVDRLLERAKEVTRFGKYTALESARCADDRVILVDAHPRHAWLLTAVTKRLREELASLHVEINEEKSRIVDLVKGEAFGFLGCAFRRVRSRRGVWWPQRTPLLKKRTAVLRTLKEVFRHAQSQPVARVIDAINPVLRGWVNYFAHGNASRGFSYVRDWVEQKVRRHLMRARNRPGLGWTRGSRRWLYETLGLFGDYRTRYLRASSQALPTR